MDYFNEDFLDMNDQTSEIIGIFVSGDAKDKVHNAMCAITDEANNEHRANCEHDDKCRGVSPYLLSALKRYFLYNELTDRERLALVATASYSLGVRSGEAMAAMGGVSNMPSFAEFMKEMRKGAKDG